MGKDGYLEGLVYGCDVVAQIGVAAQILEVRQKSIWVCHCAEGVNIAEDRGYWSWNLQTIARAAYVVSCWLNSQWDPNRESATSAQLAATLQRPLHRLHQLRANPQAHAGASELAVDLFVGLSEGLKQLLLILFGDPAPRVRHLDREEAEFRGLLATGAEARGRSGEV